MRFLTLLTWASLIYTSLAASMTDFTPVRDDLKALFRNSQAFWPADFGHYGPFFVRLAWHCSGSYRVTDGRGGCDGARQRFDPERSWDDNTNLDKARHLLLPIKEKYGEQLSWGDLIILAGTTAIEDMGGPVLGFCGGRVDDKDGSASIKLGPTHEQEVFSNCTTPGDCQKPFGTTTIGLIYVNPEGPMGQPNPEGSYPQIRDTFGRMAMNDSETVALIGGGHAFGKTHGACPTGPGPAPKDQPNNPWPGTCGTGDMKGKGRNTFTSGFEGPWTTTPTMWSNEYFQNLLNFNWSVHIGPGGHNQWGAEGINTMMLTSDVSLLHDTKYYDIVSSFANDIEVLNNAFSHAWYKLVSRDMGPVSRCVGDRVPPAQDFQYPLPPTPSKLANFEQVRKIIENVLDQNPDMIPSLVHLTYQCASTFRQTDYLGGCNGARIQFAPENTWDVNNGTDKTISFLKSKVIDAYTGEGALSVSDTIVLAGQIAVEKSTGLTLNFCPGRTDATDGLGSQYLAPRQYDDADVLTTLMQVRDLIEISGFSARQVIALQGRPRSATQQQMIGYSGSWTDQPTTLTNSFFTTLINENWELQVSAAGKNEYKAVGKDNVFVTPQDLALIWDAEYYAIVQEFAANNTLFLNEFADAWTTLVNADRFDGPTGNVCNTVNQVQLAQQTTTSASTGFSQSSLIAGIFGGIFLGVMLSVLGVFGWNKFHGLKSEGDNYKSMGMSKLNGQA